MVQQGNKFADGLGALAEPGCALEHSMSADEVGRHQHGALELRHMRRVSSRAAAACCR